MRQETNNEMDLLLRRLSRRGDGSASDGGTSTEDRHLDVDELSSFAQNALPAAARARYTEHLADCASCRKLVTELSLSLGAVTVAAPVEAGLAPSGLKGFLASLFSPMVLRYAVPALAVIVVMVIGFVALRRQQTEQFVAQVEPKRMSDRVEPRLVAPTPAAPQGFTDKQQPQTDIDQQSRGAQPTSGKRDNSGREGAAAGSAGTAPVSKQRDAARDEAPSATRPLVAAAEPPPAAPKIVADGEIQETRKEKKAEADVKKQPEATVATGTADTAKAGENKNANEAATVSERRVSNLPSQNRTYGDLTTLRPSGVARSREDKDKVETQSVAGRKFKKERGIWIDTAYDSSTDTVNLARGSEQFRALVADEPAIKTIAEKLDGEVIVVWKGRAYHIR
jgi:hypothetical protein